MCWTRSPAHWGLWLRVRLHKLQQWRHSAPCCTRIEVQRGGGSHQSSLLHKLLFQPVELLLLLMYAIVDMLPPRSSESAWNEEMFGSPVSPSALVEFTQWAQTSGRLRLTFKKASWLRLKWDFIQASLVTLMSVIVLFWILNPAVIDVLTYYSIDCKMIVWMKKVKIIFSLFAIILPFHFTLGHVIFAYIMMQYIALQWITVFYLLHFLFSNVSQGLFETL